jgi:sigma-B regulation protein RsbU (phosphoserine phosphatase)
VKLKTRILLEIFCISLVLILVLSVLFFLSVAGIRSTVLSNSRTLGESSAGISSRALQQQVVDNIEQIAEDMALIIDEKLLKIENNTRMAADIASSIYTRRETYRPHSLTFLPPGGMSPPEPYVHTAPSVQLQDIRREVDLMGNIGSFLRQITVVDRGIVTSAIGGESGYIIAMDAFPWPSVSFDPRQYDGYSGAKEEGRLYWTDVYADVRGRGVAFSCSMPFYERSGGREVFKGVAHSTALLTDFLRILESAKVGHSGYVFLLNKAGMKILSPGSVDVKIDSGGAIRGENYLESSSPRLRSLGLSMTLGATGMMELELQGEPVYAAYSPIHTLGWSLGVAIPQREITSPGELIKERILVLTGGAQKIMDRYIFVMAGLIGCMLFVSLSAAAFFSVRFSTAITRPILALNEGVREVSAGNLEREVVIKTGDEIEQLAASFNVMTGRLREHIEKIALVTAEKERIATELDVARQIQTSMLPYEFPPFAGKKNEFDLYALISPAREVGGDFYDFFFIDDERFAVIIADVSGKGIPAALFMAITKTLIKNSVQGGESPAKVLTAINRQLCSNNTADMFVTLWLGIFETSRGRLEYVNAGHNPPLVKTGGGDFRFLSGPPELFLAGMDDTVYHSNSVELEAGDILFLYTDGVTEAADGEENLYGKIRLKNFLDANGGLSVRELLPRLQDDIGFFTGGAEQSDDITMLALSFTRGGGQKEPGENSPVRRLCLKADVAELDELQSFIGKRLRAFACPEKTYKQVEVCVEEIFVNIANYAYSPGSGEVDVEVSSSFLGEEVRVSIVFSDRGRPYNPLEHDDPDINLPFEEKPVGGLGILIVKRMMDSIQYRYEDGRNRLEISKSWRPERREEA